MVAPAFGFSVGDFVAGIEILIKVGYAFKETGGAASKYVEEVAFLNALTSTILRLEEYAKVSPQNEISKDISKLVEVIREPLAEFKAFLDKYMMSLGASSTRSTIAKVPRTVTYTVKVIRGKVETLRRQIEQPISAVNSLLSLRVM
jgi:hypothetical protein